MEVEKAFQHLQFSWETFGKQDPMWAILTDPAKYGNKWTAEEFFQTGVDDVVQIINYVNGLGLSIDYSGQALDFGCGIGRLTQALAERQFEGVVGVDIAESMIKTAESYNYEDNCHYRVNTVTNLRIFGDKTFTFILSLIVLQHMKQEYAISYIKEFLRILKPGGILFFQIPSHRIDPNSPYAGDEEMYNSPEPVMEMHGVYKEDVLKLIEENGGKVVDVSLMNCSGPQWTSYKYCVQKI